MESRRPLLTACNADLTGELRARHGQRRGRHFLVLNLDEFDLVGSLRGYHFRR